LGIPPKFHALTFRFGRRASIRGFDVRAFLPLQSEWSILQSRIEEALRLIELHSPLRFRYLQRDIQRIWITLIPSRGAYLHGFGMCVIDFDYAIDTDTTSEELALTLVHEGTHARLSRRGFSYHESVRPRIERICIRNELAVARRLTDSGDLIEMKEGRLAWEDKEWSDETLDRDDVEYLRRLGWWPRLAHDFVTFMRDSPWRSNERCS
jgi:hypothetical protein